MSKAKIGQCNVSQGGVHGILQQRHGIPMGAAWDFIWWSTSSHLRDQEKHICVFTKVSSVWFSCVERLAAFLLLKRIRGDLLLSPSFSGVDGLMSLAFCFSVFSKHEFLFL